MNNNEQIIKNLMGKFEEAENILFNFDYQKLFHQTTIITEGILQILSGDSFLEQKITHLNTLLESIINALDYKDYVEYYDILNYELKSFVFSELL